MKKVFLYDKQTGRVASYSDGMNEVPDKFAQLELEVTDVQYNLILLNYDLWVKKGKLVIEKPERIIKEEKLKSFEEAKETLIKKRDEGKIASLEELQNLLLKII